MFTFCQHNLNFCPVTLSSVLRNLGKMPKEEDYDDSFDEDDDVGILKQALHVEMPKNFNPKKIPQTGEEYLQHVLYERRQCKSWVTADIDRAKFKNQQTFKVEMGHSIKKAPSALVPTFTWQMNKLEHFKMFRKYIHFKLNEESTSNQFCEEKFLEMAKSEYPKYSKITKYTQAAKMRMLIILSKSLDSIPAGQSVCETWGTWIFAILTLLEKPLNPDFCFTLREFAKRCMAVRANLDEDANEELYNPLNLFICVVSRFYGQLDLADS